MCQGGRLDPQSGHIQESTNECRNKWNNKSISRSLKSIKTNNFKAFPFPESLKTECGQPDNDVPQVTTAHAWTIFVLLLCGPLRKFTWTPVTSYETFQTAKDASSLKSRNLDCSLQKLAYNLLRSLTFVYLLFSQTYFLLNTWYYGIQHKAI